MQAPAPAIHACDPRQGQAPSASQAKECKLLKKFNSEYPFGCACKSPPQLSPLRDVPRRGQHVTEVPILVPVAASQPLKAVRNSGWNKKMVLI